MSYNCICLEGNRPHYSVNLREAPWLHPAVEVRNSPISGKGLFAAKEIKAGEVVLICGGKLFRKADIRKGKARTKSLTGFDEGFYLGTPSDAPEGRDEFLNHSCNPNLWLKDRVTLIARKTISQDSELTTDYATWEIDGGWAMPDKCNCGSQLCRGFVTGNDWMLDSLQYRYQYHFLPCLNDRIQRYRFKHMSVLGKLLEPVQPKIRAVFIKFKQNFYDVDGSLEMVRHGITPRKQLRRG